MLLPKILLCLQVQPQSLSTNSTAYESLHEDAVNVFIRIEK